MSARRTVTGTVVVTGITGACGWSSELPPLGVAVRSKAHLEPWKSVEVRTFGHPHGAKNSYLTVHAD